MRRGNCWLRRNHSKPDGIPKPWGDAQTHVIPAQPLVIPAQAGIQRGGAQEGQGGTAPAQPPNQSQYRAGGNPEEEHAGGAGFHT